MEKFTDVVGKLIYGHKVRGYGFMSLADIRELYRVWCEYERKPEFINGNVKKALDKLGIATETCGVGWKVV